ncbi:14-3-3 protein SGF14e [Hibiscus syriacus]|uniref:14-3-3 protein SGF14e n=1 Tax=Hibiscus syriacus TaxID=106335 RepID=A0A6A2XHE5_HIBSY|nr:14-3-3 protein SGF14e [Hibiscus syriacus]
MTPHHQQSSEGVTGSMCWLSLKCPSIPSRNCSNLFHAQREATHLTLCLYRIIHRSHPPPLSLLGLSTVHRPSLPRSPSPSFQSMPIMATSFFRLRPSDFSPCSMHSTASDHTLKRVNLGFWFAQAFKIVIRSNRPLILGPYISHLASRIANFDVTRRRESKFKGFHRYSSFSIHDHRLYRVIELDNGLVALLVHDPQIYPNRLPEGSHLLDKAKNESGTEDNGEDEDDDENGYEDGDDKEEEDTDDEKHIEEKVVQSKKEYIAGRTSEATFDDVFEKKIAIFRYLGGCEPTGENLQLSHKKEAAKQCDYTLLDVENALSKFTWAKEVHKKMVKLKEEGKPMPKNFPEVQKLMGSTPLDLAKYNMAESGQMSRNAPCPCGSNKRYKRLVG